MSDKDQSDFRSDARLGWSCVASAVLLAVFWWLQVLKSPGMELKAQWIGVALLPILLALITGHYIGKLKFLGLEYEQYRDQIQRLEEIPEQQARSGLSAIPTARSADELSATGRSQVAETAASAGVGAPLPSWTALRQAEYSRTRSLVLVHVYERSKRPDQKFDVTLFLMRHVPGTDPNQRTRFDEVDKLEIYLGRAWGNRFFTASNNGGFIGLRTSAWGTFLATAQVTFRDGHEPVILHRYVDFEMGPAA
jgi:hypothetical protein